MEPKPAIHNVINGNFAPEPRMDGDIFLSAKRITDDLFERLTNPAGKKSFLVSRHNKYIKILTENIALFYIRNETVMMACFDRQEYLVNYSLDQIQNLLPGKQFYRLNRQCLINFNAVLEAEHYFGRKLLVNPVIPTKEKLIVSKDKVTAFLHWLDSR